MNGNVNDFFDDNPNLWITELPEFQRKPLEQLLGSGLSYEETAQRWLSASAANNFQLSTLKHEGKGGPFLDNVRKEVRAFLCGDAKYEKERTGLFGKNSATRTYVVSAIAVAIAPHLTVAAAFVAPVVALIIAAIGKITLTAWCESSSNVDQ